MSLIDELEAAEAARTGNSAQAQQDHAAEARQIRDVSRLQAAAGHPVSRDEARDIIASRASAFEAMRDMRPSLSPSASGAARGAVTGPGVTDAKRGDAVIAPEADSADRGGSQGKSGGFKEPDTETYFVVVNGVLCTQEFYVPGGPVAVPAI
jgi:hypothetical protein